MQITLDLTPETVAYLAAAAHNRSGSELDRARDALHYLASSAADGMRRPGAWERGVVLQLFGDEWRERLEPKPDDRFGQLQPIPDQREAVAELEPPWTPEDVRAELVALISDDDFPIGNVEQWQQLCLDAWASAFFGRAIAPEVSDA